MNKVLLAYSGGLDTSTCIPWLTEHYGLSVITFTADLGQGVAESTVAERALASGAESAEVVDLREPFLEEFAFPSLRAGALYQDGYPLATALGRPLIARELVRLAQEKGCGYVAHGCTGKGNDQVRLEASIVALDPSLKVIAPAREWSFESREQEIAYCQQRDVPTPSLEEGSAYSIDRNLWGVSIECGDVLEDPAQAPPEDAYQITVPPETAPDEPLVLEVGFERGRPVALDGRQLKPIELVTELDRVGGAHGIGRIDMVEDRLVGIKSREVYEAPGATILHVAHRGLEALTIGRELRRLMTQLSAVFAQLVYDGYWYSEVRAALQAFYDRAQRYVTGMVRVRLYKGSCTVIGRTSPHSLYDYELATYGPEDEFDHAAAEGFIRLWTLPLVSEARRSQAEERVDSTGRSG